MMPDLPDWVIDDLIMRALNEDVGEGDVTTIATVLRGAHCQAELVAKDDGILAGLGLAEATFRKLDRKLDFKAEIRDGDSVSPGMVIARLEGDAQAILIGERTALNFLQRMSGIATLTSRYVKTVAGTKARICDTRKTAPGLRIVDKYAVRVGGGHNHRFGLFDGVLIKDNHIRAAGGIGSAVERVRASSHHLLKIEVEAQNLAQVEQALEAGMDVIMLDNMTPAQVRQAVDLIDGRAQTEVSGGVTLDTVRSYAECGVDYISVGELTHSPVALDLSLEIIET